MDGIGACACTKRMDGNTKLLGVGIVGVSAGDLLPEAVLAIETGV